MVKALIWSILIGLVILFVYAVYSVALAATPRCAPHADMLDILAKHYKEAPMAVGLINEARFIEVLASREGTFTILVTDAEGKACIVAAGQDFEEVPDHLKSLDPQT